MWTNCQLVSICTHCFTFHVLQIANWYSIGIQLDFRLGRYRLTVLYHWALVAMMPVCVKKPQECRYYGRHCLQYTECFIEKVPHFFHNISQPPDKSIRSIHYEHNRQRKRTKYSVPQVDKGASLHCYYVKRWICMWHLFYTFLHNSSEGMFLCLPAELYILSAFFVSHIHSDCTCSVSTRKRDENWWSICNPSPSWIGARRTLGRFACIMACPIDASITSSFLPTNMFLYSASSESVRHESTAVVDDISAGVG